MKSTRSPILTRNPARCRPTRATVGLLVCLVLAGTGCAGETNQAAALTGAPPATTPAPASPDTPAITAADLANERTARYGNYTVSGLPKNGMWVVTFDPALARDDRVVLGAAEFVLKEFLSVDPGNAQWLPVDRFLRLATGGGTFDVLLIKNDEGTVYGMSVQRR